MRQYPQGKTGRMVRRGGGQAVTPGLALMGPLAFKFAASGPRCCGGGPCPDAGQELVQRTDLYRGGHGDQRGSPRGGRHLGSSHLSSLENLTSIASLGILEFD